MVSKSGLKKFMFQYSGYGSLKWRYKKPGLYCFNYHRIGIAESSAYDPNVFSCTPAMFKQHLAFYQDNFELINLEKLLTLMSSGKPLDKHYALITFDDGYLDNYEYAFPILKEHGISALFFVPTNYVANCQIPWWDEIAWMLKRSRISTLNLPFGDKAMRLNNANTNIGLRQVITKIKQNRQVPIEVVLDAIREQTQQDVRLENARLFMNWDMLREMVKYNMDIGSHSCSHKILSNLSCSDQESEVQLSKKKIEQELSITVKAFAYPEGGINTYNQDTIRTVKKADYAVGFNFISGINFDISQSQFELNRLPVSLNCKSSDLKNLIASFQ